MTVNNNHFKLSPAEVLFWTFIVGIAVGMLIPTYWSKRFTRTPENLTAMKLQDSIYEVEVYDESYNKTPAHFTLTEMDSCEWFVSLDMLKYKHVLLIHRPLCKYCRIRNHGYGK